MAKKDSVKRDIFISYSTKNFDKAEAIRDELRNNGLSCWMAPDDIRPGENYAEDIMVGLRAATMVVLVFSEFSQESIYVTNEIKTAFDMEKPIIAYKLDETLPKGKMEFYLKNKQWIDASNKSDYKDSFGELVSNAKRLCSEENEKNKRQIDLKIPIVAVAIILIAVVGFIAFSGNGEVVETNTTSDNITIDFVELVSDGGNSYSYSVVGSVPSQLSNSSKDKVHVDFYDESGKVVESDDVSIEDAEGNILGNAYVEKDNIVKVSAELRNGDGEVISSAESSDIEENNM